MAKGDSQRVQSQIENQGGLAQNRLNNVRDSLVPQNQDLQNRFQVSADASQGDRRSIMSGYDNYLDMAKDPNGFWSYGGYQNFANGGRDASFDPLGYGGVSNAMSRYNEFADTGGYNPGDIASMRARSQGSLRSAYDSAQRNIDRERRLRGGNSPNYTAAQARLTRDMGQGLSDANINLEAELADRIRAGKMFGIQGLGQTGLAQEGAGISLAGLNNQSRLAGLQGANGIDIARLQSILGGLSGKTSAYSATPGETNMYGGLLNQSNSQLLNVEQLQQAIAQLIINSQIARSQVPSDWNQALGNIGGTVNLAGKIGAGIAGLGTGGATTSLGQIGTVAHP